jgi:8-oxo-dGTP pyrophosphatase MutT (NUDIX family)
MTGLSPDELKARLDSETRTRTAPNLRPVDAATLILMDLKASKPKVLMGKRSMKLKFMPGKYVFPGGRVDAGDRTMPASGALAPRMEQRLMAQTTRMTPQRCRALAMAAIRETFEETGFPTPDALTFVARAITPPKRPRRFDTRFFLAPLTAVGGKVERDIGPDAELTDLVWVDLTEAAKLDLPAITQVILVELMERLALGHDQHAPIPFYYERHRRFIRETV